MKPAMLLMACLASAWAAAGARAQTTAPGQPAPTVPGPTTTPPEQMAPPLAPGTGATGLIRPPAAIDPGIRAPAPMPAQGGASFGGRSVIAPPGTPGGNPDVVPK